MEWGGGREQLGSVVRYVGSVVSWCGKSECRVVGGWILWGLKIKGRIG